MAASTFLCTLWLFCLLSPSISSPSTTTTTTTTITLPLSPFTNPNPSPDPYHKLSYLASLSKSRAKQLKNPQNAHASTTSTPVYSHSYGAYTISLSFGTPPQTIPFVMDTGSDLVWSPCTSHYLCQNCPSVNIPPFIPRNSSSAKLLGCLNPKCGLLSHLSADPHTRCQGCSNLNKCNQTCSYIALYGSGITGGVYFLETLNLPGKKVPSFLLGCSLFSSHIPPAGIAGFGRGLASLPTQLGLKKFSYCLLSRALDDTSKSSQLILDSGSNSGKKTGNLSYTPLLKNPVVPGKHGYSVYYYVGLRKITVGGRKVDIPYKFLSPGKDGNGGTIVDSGTTFTYMERDLFEIVFDEVVKQVKGCKRDENAEAETGLRLCYNVSGLHGALVVPEMKLHFKGGANLALPLENYFVLANEELLCLAVVTGSEASGDGPAIILGAFQMQNFYVEYDLKNERFGFQPQSCE